jgi:RNA polymerase sigma factor (sigma-70 family)
VSARSNSVKAASVTYTNLSLDNVTRERSIRFLRGWRFAFTREEAEDIYQNAAVCALKTRHPFNGQSKFSTWFTRILINCAKMAGRKTKWAHLERVELEQEFEAPAKEEDYLLRDRVRIAICHLRPQERELIIAYYYHGAELHEIAASLHIKFNTMKARIHRARVHLREELKDAA